ncbi:MAG TPA: hypothetical protein VEH80_00085, partial [Candidatus Bathyarchaeia archaeon]|nr:hypothetical protein [Candidatus Bathyarchaeia archaeon]
MRNSSLSGALLCLLVVPMLTSCVVPGPSTPPEAQVMQADARALAYGRSAAEILENPQLRDKVRALFAADWAPPTAGGVGKLSGAAPEYFELGGPVRMVHVGDANYITVTGCVRQTCAARRGLLLIREGGEQLLARLDDGGFLHQYAYGSGLQPAAAAPVVDSALRALEGVSD